MKRRIAALGVVGLMAVVWWFPSPSATGAAPERQGWWKAAGPLAGIGLPVIGEIGGPSTADVPDGGLLVAGDPAGGPPQAIAAVVFPVDGAVGGPLRLLPAEGAASVPGSTLTACPLDVPEFEPAEGGPMADAPRFDCFGGVAATVGGDGAYLFDVTTVVRGDRLAVAIVPTKATDRVVFTAPGDDALPLAAAADEDDDPSPATSEPATVALDDDVTSAGSSSVTGGGGTSDFEVPPLADVPAPDSGATAASAPATAGIAPADAVEPALAASSSPSDRHTGRTIILLTMAAAAGLLWVGAGGRAA